MIEKNVDDVHWQEHQWCDVKCKYPKCGHECSDHSEIGHPGGFRPCMHLACPCSSFSEEDPSREQRNGVEG